MGAPFAGMGGGVSLADFLTTLKNLPNAFSTLYQAYLGVQGTRTSLDISAATLVTTGKARLCTVVVTTAGAVGKIYDATSTSATTGIIYITPASVGVFVVNMPVFNGIVVHPGAGQVVSVSYSQ